MHNYRFSWWNDMYYPFFIILIILVLDMLDEEMCYRGVGISWRTSKIYQLWPSFKKSEVISVKKNLFKLSE